MKIKQVSVGVEKLDMKQKQKINLGVITSLKAEILCHLCHNLKCYNYKKLNWKS